MRLAARRGLGDQPGGELRRGHRPGQTDDRRARHAPGREASTKGRPASSSWLELIVVTPSLLPCVGERAGEDRRRRHRPVLRLAHLAGQLVGVG